MESKFYQPSYHTPSNKSLPDNSHLFDPTSPTNSSTSVKRFERKPDFNQKKNNSRGKRQSNNTVFAGFYSPKNHHKLNLDASDARMDTILKDSVLTRRENIQFFSAKDMALDRPGVVRKGSGKAIDKTARKENEDKYDNFEYETLVSKNKKLEGEVARLEQKNEELSEKIYQVTSELKDLQKRLQNRQGDIKQYQQKQKNYQLELTKLRQENIMLQEHNRDQQGELDLLDRKYLQVQIQIKEIRKSKDLKKRDSEEFLEKISTLQEVIKQKDQEIYKLIAHNSKLNCQMWTREQRLHQLEHNASFKKDGLLEQTNKKLRLVNKELMHRVNSLLTSSSNDCSDVEFQLSPQK